MKNIIVIPFNIPWNWSTDYTNQTAIELSKENMVVCYMWAEFFTIKEYIKKATAPVLVKKYSDSMYIYYPISFIPFIRFKKIVAINEKINIFLLKMFINYLGIRNKISKKILWIFDPKLYPLVKQLGENFLILYDCVDYFLGTALSRTERITLTRYEFSLVKKANLVTANSLVLQRHLQKIRKDVLLVPQGFRINSFNRNIKSSVRIKTGNTPLIGFLGAVNYRIDYELLYNLAKSNPKWDFAIWGPLLEQQLFTTSKLSYFYKLTDLSNVITGQSDKSEVSGIMNQFDIGMIPYDSTLDFNIYCYPMKLFEYFYLGKPVVSTTIEELKRFPKFIKIGHNSNEWAKIIKNILSKPWPKDYIKMERRLASDNSWANKVNIILSSLQALNSNNHI